MTPKEKAKSLLFAFKIKIDIGLTENQRVDVLFQINLAKQCALIAVEELIKETGSKYWYSVKQELEQWQIM
jgi:hypothetical protein